MRFQVVVWTNDNTLLQKSNLTVRQSIIALSLLASRSLSPFSCHCLHPLGTILFHLTQFMLGLTVSLFVLTSFFLRPTTSAYHLTPFSLQLTLPLFRFTPSSFYLALSLFLQAPPSLHLTLFSFSVIRFLFHLIRFSFHLTLLLIQPTPHSDWKAESTFDSCG